MEKQRIHTGRFLPARVYTRWKWAIRTGLLLIPLILFLAGGVAIYMTPLRYKSTATFEYLGPRSAHEAASLLKSHHVGDALSKFRTSFGDGWSMVDHLSDSKIVNTRVNRESGFIELEVMNSNKNTARDMAVKMIEALGDYEKSIVVGQAKARIQALEARVTESEDLAAEKRQALAKLMVLRSSTPVDPLLELNIDSARAEWEFFNRQALEDRGEIAGEERAIATAGPWVVVHSKPLVAQTAEPGEETLPELIWWSLGVGLAFALTAPYLLELAFPRRHRSRRDQGEAWEHQGHERALSSAPAHG